MDLDNLYKRKPTSLISAVREGNIDAVKDLLKKGVSHPNSADHRGWTALHEAASKNQLEIVKILLGDERTNPDAPAHGGDLALNVAVNSSATVQLVDCLASHTTQLLDVEYAYKLLDDAISGGSVDIVGYLITNTCVDIKGEKYIKGDKYIRQYSPVSKALQQTKPNEEVIRVLLDACDDINALYLGDDEKYSSILLFALEAGCSLPIIRLLINQGALYNFKYVVNSSGVHKTALTLAIEMGRIDVAFEVLKHDVDVSMVADFSTNIALTSAIRTKNLDLVKAILPRTSVELLEKLSVQRYNGFNGIICLALAQSDEGIVSLLLNCDFPKTILEAPVHIKFALARPSLSYSFVGPLGFLLKERIDSQHISVFPMMELLLSKGISIEPINEQYMPPLVALLVAWSKGSGLDCQLVLRDLLDLGVNVDYKSQASLPDALLTAIHFGNLVAVTMMLPYSQYTPYDIFRMGIENKMIFVWDIVWEKLNAIDDISRIEDFQNDGGFLYPCRRKVMPLTILARQKVRQSLPRTKTSSEFLNLINALEIPESLKRFLRFLK